MIRTASIEDIPAIVKMLKEYSKSINIKCAASKFSTQQTSKLAAFCIQQGYAWVYEKDGKTIGSLIAREQVNLFTDSLLETQLIGVYVYPEFRNGLAGGKLLKAYDQECERRNIKLSWVGAQVTTELSEKSLARLGYNLSEQQFKKER